MTLEEIKTDRICIKSLKDSPKAIEGEDLSYMAGRWSAALDEVEEQQAENEQLKKAFESMEYDHTYRFFLDF